MKLAFFSTAWQVAKALPALYALLREMWTYFAQREIDVAMNAQVTRNTQWAALTKAISKAETNEERLALSLTLAELSKP